MKSGSAQYSKASPSRKSSTYKKSSTSRISRNSLIDEEAELAVLEVELTFAEKKGLSEEKRVILEEKVAKKRACERLCFGSIAFGQFAPIKTPILSVTFVGNSFLIESRYDHSLIEA